MTTTPASQAPLPPSMKNYTGSRLVWLAALIGLPLLAWFGPLDSFSETQVNTSLSSAGVIYGTARGINALVSVLQGTEFNIPFLTVAVGEVLDPVNDLIERFSDVIFLALGSLGLQKVLLSVVATTVFNVILSGIALAAAVLLFAGRARWLALALRAFVIAAFLRFALAIVVLANSWVDAAFLSEADQERHAAMEQFKGELRNVEVLAGQLDDSAMQSNAAREQLLELEARRASQREADRIATEQLAEAERNLAKASAAVDALCALSIYTPVVSPTCPLDVRDQYEVVTQLKRERAESRTELARTEKKITQTTDRLLCLDANQQGKGCSIWENLPGLPDVSTLRAQMSALETRVGDFAQNLINLMASLLLKTIAIPLLFAFGLLRAARYSLQRPLPAGKTPASDES